LHEKGDTKIQKRLNWTLKGKGGPSEMKMRFGKRAKTVRAQMKEAQEKDKARNIRTKWEKKWLHLKDKMESVWRATKRRGARK